MKFVPFLEPKGKTLYINPDAVAFVRDVDSPDEYHPTVQSVIVFINGQQRGVVENVAEVKAKLELQ